METSENNPLKLKAWLEAMRLRTLPVSVAGVIAGCGVALMCGHFAWAQALICFFFAVIAQIVSNFANEYYDYANGLDKKGREGFRRGVTEGDLSPQAMKRATYVVLAADCLLGLSLTIWGGPWLIAVGVLIAIFAIAYSTGPYPLSHHGLGDLAVIIFYGIVPVGFTAYVMNPTVNVWHKALPVGIAAGLLAANVLIVNNYRDMEADREVGKHTTVVIFGRKFMGAAYLFFMFAALLLLTIAGIGVFPLWCVSGYAIAAIAGTAIRRQLVTKQGSALNAVLKRTAQLMLAICLYFLVLAAIFGV